MFVAGSGEGVFAVYGRNHLKTTFLQIILGQLDNLRFIINHENEFVHGRIIRGSSVIA